MYIDAASPEDFVSRLMAMPRGFGLDTANWEVLPWPGDKGEPVCKKRPPQIAARHMRRAYIGKEAGGSALAIGGIYWFQPLGVLRRGREWRVAASCKRKAPFTGWERVSVDVVHDVLMDHAQRYYYMYWPRGLPEKAEELRHVAVFGVSMSGKTTFTIETLRRLGSFYVIDLTTHGEYSGIAPVYEGAIDLGQFSVEELVKLYTIAMTAVVGEEEKAGMTGVQFGVLRRLAPFLKDVNTLLETIATANMPGMTEITRHVLYSKLSALCESIGQEGCIPHKALTVKFEPPPPPAVIRVDPTNPMVAAFVAHGIVMTLLKRRAASPTYIVIDEFHKIMPKVEVADPVMETVVAGRHMNYYVWISTQSPRHLRPDVLSVFPTQVFFQLREDADIASQVLGVPPQAITSLKTGEWLAVTPLGKRRWTPTLRS